jgi:hypothetical protein
MPTETVDTRQSYPYTSFRTLTNLVEKFEKDGSMPPKIDRSVLGGSEGQKSQVLSALKFFGLIGEQAAVTPLFRQLVNEPTKRKAIIRSLLEKHYSDALALSAENGTAAQLWETFRPLTSDTLRKAVSFFLNAAEFAELTLSKNFKAPSAPAAARTVRRRVSGGDGDGIEDVRTQTPADATPAEPKAAYLAMLMEKARNSEGELGDKLLDRIERLLGYREDVVPE